MAGRCAARMQRGVSGPIFPHLKTFGFLPLHEVVDAARIRRAIPAKPLILLARSERFELPTLGIEIRCSIQLSYERIFKYLIEFTYL